MAIIYTDAVLTALEALEAIAKAASSTVAAPGTPLANVPLFERASARIEVSKFGDEVPITIDIDGEGATWAAQQVLWLLPPEWNARLA